MFMEHLALSGLARSQAPDFETGWEWQRRSIEGSAQTAQAGTYLPTLITDQASAFLDPLSIDPLRIAEFMTAVAARFAIVGYADGNRRREHYFVLQGTDGVANNYVCFFRKDNRLGPSTLKTFDGPARPTWEDPLIGPIARAIREVKEAGVPGRGYS
jgi:hypothetical protein